MHGTHTHARFDDLDLDFESVPKARPSCFSLSSEPSLGKLLSLFIVQIVGH